MVNKTVTVTTSKGGKGKSTTTRTTGSKQNNRRSKSQNMGTYNPLTGHYMMLTDPCNSTLTESAYRGQAGIPSRFTRSWTVSSPGSSSYIYAFNPAAIGAFANAVINSATVTTPVETTQGPGFTFITTNAGAWRAVGYCLQVDYIGTELNRSGKLYTGCVSAQTVKYGVATTVNDLKVLFPNSVRTPDSQLESKWFPGVDNEEYGDRTVTTDSYDAGKNVLVFLAENMPDGVQLAFKEVLILEWTPLPGLGFVAPGSTAGYNPPAAYERLHAAASKDPSFVHSFSMSASKRLGQYAHSAGSGFVDLGMMALRAGAKGAVRSAMRAAPLLLGA